eukprot:CAMPEP_0114650222 /NCGR_PEP_ID=MMETSP0191-20121206/7535_1 /TAXON_ID=126664 /ORGANISM="Sorites sp." /LENGTH=238 /DNA_ID=CAMNT_0001864035 /DNA_START=34 /DNA_END=750 /DNA_ORIENTATION=-
MTYLELNSATDGVKAEAVRWLCPTWTWCTFTVKDCFGDVLYEVVADWRTDLNSEGEEMLGTSVMAYLVKSKDGTVLGRTSRLTTGEEPVRIFNAQGDQLAVMVTAAGWFWRLFYPIEWYVNIDNPGATVEEEPMQDPRLLTFIVTFQYRNLNYFSTFTEILLILVALFFLYYWVASRRHGRCECSLPLWIRDCLENRGMRTMFASREPLVYDDASTSCCGGRNKTQWKTNIQPLTPAE